MPGRRLANASLESQAKGHPLLAWIARTGVGTASIALHVGVHRQMVYQWINGSKPISARCAIELEKFTNGDIRCEELAPDVDWQGLVDLRRSYPE